VFGVDEGQGRGIFWETFMVIQDDDIKTHFFGLAEFFRRRRSIVDSDDKGVALLGDVTEGVFVETVAFRISVRDVIGDRGPEGF